MNDACDYKNLILKLGDRGVFCVSNEKDAKSSYFSVDSFATKVVDAVGSGDALLAYATLTMLAGGSLVAASILGSIAAACECEFDGNIPIKPEDILAKIEVIEHKSGYQSDSSK